MAKKEQRTISDEIYSILYDKIHLEADYCYCDGNCSGGHDSIDGHSDAVIAIEKLLEKNGIDPKQFIK